MARYPKGTGKKNEKKRSILKIEPQKPKPESKIETIEQLKAIESDQSTDFDSNIDRIQAEIAAQTTKNLNEKAEIELKESKPELIAPPKADLIQKIDSNNEIETPFSEEETTKRAKEYETVIEIALGVVDEAVIFYLKDQRAKMPEPVKVAYKESLSVFAAILWPDVSGMSPKEKMMLFAGFAALGATKEYATHLIEVKNGSKDKILKDATNKAG